MNVRPLLIAALGSFALNAPALANCGCGGHSASSAPPAPQPVQTQRSQATSLQINQSQPHQAGGPVQFQPVQASSPAPVLNLERTPQFSGWAVFFVPAPRAEVPAVSFPVPHPAAPPPPEAYIVPKGSTGPVPIEHRVVNTPDDGGCPGQTNSRSRPLNYDPSNIVTVTPPPATVPPPAEPSLESVVDNILAVNNRNNAPAKPAPAEPAAANADTSPATAAPTPTVSGGDVAAVPVPAPRTEAPAPAAPDPVVLQAQRDLDAAMAKLRDSLRTRPAYAAALAERQAAADATAALRARGEASPDQLLPAARRGLEANQRVTAIEREAAAKDPQVQAARARLTTAAKVG